jgi:hypothetical protein
VIYVTTVVVRAALFAVPERFKDHRFLGHAIDVLQMSNLVLSLLTNVLATSIISFKAWCVCALEMTDCTPCDTRVGQRKYRKLLSEGFGSSTSRASKILALLVESGMLYIVIGVSLASIVHAHGPSRAFLIRSQMWSLLLSVCLSARLATYSSL